MMMFESVIFYERPSLFLAFLHANILEHFEFIFRQYSSWFLYIFVSQRKCIYTKPTKMNATMGIFRDQFHWNGNGSETNHSNSFLSCPDILFRSLKYVPLAFYSNLKVNSCFQRDTKKRTATRIVKFVWMILCFPFYMLFYPF